MPANGQWILAHALHAHTLRTAGLAAPTPPIGPALGQRGVKAIDFCRQFNDQTKDIVSGTPMRCTINVRPDRTFAFQVRPPFTSHFLKRAAGVEKGSARCGHDLVGQVTLKHVYEIAKLKATDPQLQGVSLENVCRMVVGTAKSCGIAVVP